MKLINGTSRAVVVVLALTMMLGVGFSAPISTTRIQDRDHDWNARWDRARLARYAFALGYNRGYQDASQNSYRTYRDMQRWREASEGWQDPMGSRTIFRDSFRRGFAQGFLDARRGRAMRYSQGDIDKFTSGAAWAAPGADRLDRDITRIADQNGYRDGQRRGSYDGRIHRRTDMDTISQFRFGMNGYRTQYGDRDAYRQAYRDGFRRGYEEAFQGQSR
jgi:hypothetical protein